jgi:hypothetical protein
MMDSTKIAPQLKENELFKYYALFLNATARILVQKLLRTLATV